jgi:hypothetical protein
MAGLSVGLTAASRVPPIYRSQATVLVGPTDGVVTQTSTVRTSEDLATFYADLARRQIILEPVVRQLKLDEQWSQLRNRVSAQVPPENLRLVTVTVAGDAQHEADAVANALVDQLVSLSPAAPGGNSQAFINEQLDRLRDTIEESQRTIDVLDAEAEAATDPSAARSLRHQVVVNQQRLAEWQRAYVELISAEPTSDAGGLQVLDQASAITGMGRSGTLKLALVDAFVGAALGLVLAWVLYRRRAGAHTQSGRDSEVPSTATGGQTSPDADARANLTPRATAGVSARESVSRVLARQPADGRDVASSRHGYGLVTHANGRVAGTRTGPGGGVSRSRPRNGVPR